ncbi:32864_t:CDS:2, partial [Racocetra persica]
YGVVKVFKRLKYQIWCGESFQEIEISDMVTRLLKTWYRFSWIDDRGLKKIVVFDPIKSKEVMINVDLPNKENENGLMIFC